MSAKFRYVFLAVFGLAVVLSVVLSAARLEHTTYTAYLKVDTLVDTAQVLKMVPIYDPGGGDDTLGMDSNFYLDTFFVGGTDSLLIGWTSPVQSMIITPTVDVATTYACSVDFVTGATVGIEKDYASGVATVAALIDTLVDMINKKAVLTDSVEAEDSVTYIKLVSLFSQDNYDGRWSMITDVDGGAGTLDTASAITTAAMVCDSLTAAINDSTALAVYVTAYDSGTFVEVHSDDPGLAFLVYVGDSITDTSYKQVNVANHSTYQDTFKIIRMVWGDFEIAGIDLWANINASTTTEQGLGLSDSGYIWIYAVYVAAEVEYFVLVDSVANAGVPCSLHVMTVSDTVSGGKETDTLWKEYWSLVYRIADTASDTVMNPSYTIYVDYKLIGK